MMSAQAMSEAPDDVSPDEKMKLLKEFIRTTRREIGREVVPNHLLYILIGVALFVPSTAVVYFLPGIRRWFVPAAIVFMGSLAVIYVAHVVRAGLRLGKMQDELDLAQEELARLRAQQRKGDAT